MTQSNLGLLWPMILMSHVTLALLYSLYYILTCFLFIYRPLFEAFLSDSLTSF